MVSFVLNGIEKLPRTGKTDFHYCYQGTYSDTFSYLKP